MDLIPIFGVKESLPLKCVALSLKYVEVYPDIRHGVKIRYQISEQVRADAYLYDLGYSNISSDIHSSEVAEYYESACHDVFRAAEMGILLDLKMLSSQYFYIEAKEPKPLYLWASFTFSHPDKKGLVSTEKEMSHLALRTDRGFINKVRFSYPFSEDMELDEAGFFLFRLFVVHWASMVREFGLQ